MESFYANGKLLITGEYAVLDGALSLAIPCRFGQKLIVEKCDNLQIYWTSFLYDKSQWFNGVFSNQFEIISSSNSEMAIRLCSIFKYVRKQNPNFLINGAKIKTYLDFPSEWGLGTSSTLVSLISQYAKVEPFDVYFNTFGGSGYDIACALAKSPIIYQLKGKKPFMRKVQFVPTFLDHLYFVYLGKKQNSRDGISLYRKKSFDSKQLVMDISELTNGLLMSHSITQFQNIIDKHEFLISQYLQIPTAKSYLFNDFDGSIKSLGAWGGDFVLAISTMNEVNVLNYFYLKGYSTVIPYAQMIL